MLKLHGARRKYEALVKEVLADGVIDEEEQKNDMLKQNLG